MEESEVVFDQRKTNISVRQMEIDDIATVFHLGELPRKGDLVKMLKQVYLEHRLPWDPQAFRSHSDANLLWAAGIKPVILGPGSLEQAHLPDESVRFEQVLLASKIYSSLIASFQ